MGTYFVKSALCLAGFYLTYRLFLGNEGNFTFKRLFLMVSFIASFFIPLIPIDIPVIAIPAASGPDAGMYTPASQGVPSGWVPIASQDLRPTGNRNNPLQILT